jgi:hypothetical protein
MKKVVNGTQIQSILQGGSRQRGRPSTPSPTSIAEPQNRQTPYLDAGHAPANDPTGIRENESWPPRPINPTSGSGSLVAARLARA